MNIENLKNRDIYLCPKNDITIFYKKYLESENISVSGFIDNHKQADDIIDKQLVQNDAMIIIYSPNHWEEISKGFSQKNLLMLDTKDEALHLIPLEAFQGYNTSFKINVNRNFTQKVFWADHLKNFDTDNSSLKFYGYEWGDPENPNDELGNYLKINNLLNSIINENSHVLELGTLGGKWTQYLLKGKTITCVDINSYFIDFIKKRYPNDLEKINFYISKGNELAGIQDQSVDVLFCIDTLVRVEKEYILDYLQEIARVLTPQGKAIIHLPNWDIEDCRNRNFTQITTDEIDLAAKKYFPNYNLDSQTIVHGTLLTINIEEIE